MTTVGPAFAQTLPPATTRTQPGAAQAAFFRAAMGAAAPVKPVEAVAPVAAATQAPPERASERHMRPGALLDIRV